jgi:AdoMet-dependent rRNA methyltransferase SPB1
MMLAQQLASGEKTSHDLIDENFDKYSFRDRDGLPEWFIDDEGKHDKKQKPITKAAALAIKEKTRALNARPIKKVRYTCSQAGCRTRASKLILYC